MPSLRGLNFACPYVERGGRAEIYDKGSAMKKVLGLVSVGLLAGPMAAEASLITNGGFDTDASGWTFNRGSPGDAGWRNIGNPGGSFWVNHNGTNVGSDPDPTLSQIIATTEGLQYSLTFDFSRFAIAANITGLAVDVNGVQLATYVIPTDADWRTVNLIFTAASAASTIAFRSEINGTDYDALIDNVSVLLSQGGPSVPEPGTLALLGLGLAGLGLSRRRKAV